MDRHDRLYENYEDALFALLMDEVAREEGARLIEENERLQNDPDAAVPESLDQRSLETIHRAFSARKRPHHTAGWYLSRAAVAILAALLLFGIAYATIPAIRIRTLRVLIQASDLDSQLSMMSEENIEYTVASEQQTLAGYTLPDISRKYAVTDQGETPFEAWIKYSHDDGSIIRLKITRSESSYLDDEDAPLAEEIEIHGYSGGLIEKGNVVRVFWHDEDNKKLIYLYTTDIGVDKTLTYAEQIVYVGT